MAAEPMNPEASEAIRIADKHHIAADMILHAEDVEDRSADELVPHVEGWLRQRRAENE